MAIICQVVEVPNVSWEDIGGLENVKRELQEVRALPEFDISVSTESSKKLLVGFIYICFETHIQLIVFYC